MAHIAGSHHATLSVAGAQEDVDFHVDTLGMRFIKKTVLYDGSLSIYHLYYSNANGDASSVVTTFPFQQAGVIGRRGTTRRASCTWLSRRGRSTSGATGCHPGGWTCAA